MRILHFESQMHAPFPAECHIFHPYVTFFKSSVQFKDLHTVDPTLIYLEPEGSTYHMKSLYSGRSRIYRQHIPPVVAHHLQNVGMTADKDIRLMKIYEFPGADIVSARISSDMHHQDLESFTLKDPVQRMDEAQLMIITISRHSFKRLEGRNLFRKAESATEISGMPDFIDRFKEVTELSVKDSVCIRYQSYMHNRVI